MMYRLQESQALYTSRGGYPLWRRVPLDVRLKLKKLAMIMRRPLPHLERRRALRRYGVKTPLPTIPEAGFAWLPVGDLSGGRQLVDRWTEIAGRRKAEMEASGEYSRVIVPVEELAADRSIADFALSDDVITMIGRYLGTVPTYLSASLWWGRRHERHAGSPFFHFDSLDTGCVRIYIYLSDVGEGAGPLSFIPRQQSHHYMRRTGYLGNAIPDEEVFKYVDSKHVVVATGRAGSGFAIDTTRCLHYGSRCTDDDRLAMILSYASYYNSEQPDDCLKLVPTGPQDRPLKRLALRHLNRP